MNDDSKLVVGCAESLKQLSAEQLVRVILHQHTVIEQLQQEIERLKTQQRTDSQTSSKPPSTDILKKSEKPKAVAETAEEGKRKPGGQPGHAGKTRKGFGRVDRYSIHRPEVCPNCGSLEFSQQPVAIQVQQVAQLVERPIEVVEYHRHSCECKRCRQTHTAAWPATIVPGQDLGVSLQALLARVRQLRSSVLRKTARTVAGTR